MPSHCGMVLTSCELPWGFSNCLRSVVLISISPFQIATRSGNVVLTYRSTSLHGFSVQRPTSLSLIINRQLLNFTRPSKIKYITVSPSGSMSFCRRRWISHIRNSISSSYSSSCPRAHRIPQVDMCTMIGAVAEKRRARLNDLLCLFGRLH